MATEAQEKEAAYVRDHWDSQGKAVAYLLTVHGAVMLGCLNVLKEYINTPLYQGLGLVVALAAGGLLSGGFAYGSVTVLRSLKVKSARGTSHAETGALSASYKILFFISVGLFVIELLLIAVRLIRL